MYGQTMPERQPIEIKNELAIRNLIEIVSNPSLASMLPADILEEAKKSIALYAAVTTKYFSRDMNYAADLDSIKL